MKTRHFLLAGLCAAVLLSGTGLLADSATKTSKRIVRLEGSWRFAVGDAPERATPGFDDSEWAEIDVPETWQHEGYRDYSGFAWYRKTFSMPAGYEKQSLVLSLGRIDDTDEVFVNGHRVGGLGQFPPDYRSAYNERRVYTVPADFLHAGGDNVVAVRVYDGGGVGEIGRASCRERVCYVV